MDGDTADRADLYTLWGVEMAYAFGAFAGIDFVDQLAHENGLVRAFGLAYIAVDAFIRNQKGHVKNQPCGVAAVGGRPRAIQIWKYHRPAWQFHAQKCLRQIGIRRWGLEK
jgi:hypothetical protein